MLPRDYRLRILNKSGVTLDFSSNSANEKCSATCRGWKFDSNGAMSIESSERAIFTAAANVTDNGGEEGSSQDNSTDLYLGLNGTFRIQTDNGSASGDVILFLESSTDGGTTYPSDEANFDVEQHCQPLATINVSGAEEYMVNWSI